MQESTEISNSKKQYFTDIVVSIQNKTRQRAEDSMHNTARRS